MVSRLLKADIKSGYAEIQQRIDAEFARNTTLMKDRLLLLDKSKGLEMRVVELEEQQRALQVELVSLCSANSVLEAEVATERALSATVSQATWKAMECMEGAITELGAVPPPRSHTVDQLDGTLERLQRVREVFLPAARAYGNHCAKAAWTVALVSLQRAGCSHVDGLGAGSIPMASAAEIAIGHALVQHENNALAREFWAPSGRGATLESLRVALAQKKKRKVPTDGANCHS